MSKKVSIEAEHHEDENLSPHNKPHLTSAFGRAVESASYGDLALVAALVLTASSLWFAFAPAGQGLQANTRDAFDAVYFSIVTFTTVGYGDLYPVGFGRVFALLDVLTGLAFTALLIGKVASERQASLLMLLHTSDTQKRLADFTEQLAGLRARLAGAAAEDVRGIILVLENQPRLINGIRNYLIFNAHQATVMQMGSFRALSALYRELNESFETLTAMHRRAGDFDSAPPMRRCLANMEMIARALRRLEGLHFERQPTRSLTGTLLQKVRLIQPLGLSDAAKSAAQEARQIAYQMAASIEAERKWLRTGFHAVQRDRVLKAFPIEHGKPWPKGVTKVVAKRLGISITVATRCVIALLESGSLLNPGHSSTAVPKHYQT